MAYIDLSLSLQNTVLTAIVGELDTGGAATIEFYNGTKPATRETAVTTQTKLGTVTCSATSGTVANGALTFNPITPDSMADATGNATWARVKNGAGTVMFDCPVSTIAGAGVLQLVSTHIEAGGPIVVSSLVLHF